MNDLVVLQKIEHWQKLKGMVLDSVSSPITKRVYNMALNECMAWFQQAPRPGFTKATVSAWRVSLEERHLGSSSIIIRMSAIRKLAAEAADNGLCLSSAKPRSDDIARLTQQSEEETDFLVDRFRSGFLFQPRGLVRSHGLFCSINGHDRSEVSDDIPHRVLGEDDGLVPHSIIVEVSAPKLLDGSDSIFTIVLDPIESPFQFPAAILFRLLRHGLRAGFR